MYFHNVQTNLSKTEGTPHRPFFRLTFTFTKKKCLKIWAQHADKDMHNRIDKEQSYKKDQRIICKKQYVNGSSCVHILLLFSQKTFSCWRWKRSVHQRHGSQEVQRQNQLRRLQLLVALTHSQFTRLYLYWSEWQPAELLLFFFFCVMFFFSQ